MLDRPVTDLRPTSKFGKHKLSSGLTDLTHLTHPSPYTGFVVPIPSTHFYSFLLTRSVRSVRWVIYKRLKDFFVTDLSVMVGQVGHFVGVSHA